MWKRPRACILPSLLTMRIPREGIMGLSSTSECTHVSCLRCGSVVAWSRGNRGGRRHDRGHFFCWHCLPDALGTGVGDHSRYPQGRRGGRPTQKRRVEQQEPAPSQQDVRLRAGFLFYECPSAATNVFPSYTASSCSSSTPCV